MPIGLRFPPPQQLGTELVVPLPEQIGPYFNDFAGNSLDRMPTAVDAWIDVLDQESRAGRVPRSSFRQIRKCHPSRTGCGRRLLQICTACTRKSPVDNGYEGFGFRGGTFAEPNGRPPGSLDGDRLRP